MDFNIKVMVELNDKGKQLYYLSIVNNQNVTSELNNDGRLIASLKEIIQLLGVSTSNFKPLDEGLMSNKLYLIDEKKYMDLNDYVAVQLTEKGKQLYYLNIQGLEDEKNMSERIIDNDYLFISIKDLIRYFGDYLEQNPFKVDRIFINENDLIAEDENIKNR